MSERWRIYKCLCGHCVKMPWKSSPLMTYEFKAFETYQEAVNYFIECTTTKEETT